MKTPKKILIFFSFCFSVLCITHNTNAQCLGPVNDGEPFMFLLNGDDEATFNLSGFQVTISYDMMAEKVYLETSNGTMIHTDGAGNVVNLDPGVDITVLGNYVAPPACLFNVETNQGQFGGGTDGYVALKNGSTYGWLYLTLCGVTTCSDYRVGIEERRFDQDLTDPAVTGVCAVIPTLSQWALIILGICFLIIGISTIKQKNSSLSKIQSIF